ncbi:MAG: FtsX-like permease family protein, partial [Micrococcales bacterium]|nr:FtsX-like permease family protein [Micrococcales bacterium]
GVQAASPVITGIAILVGADGTAVGNGMAPQLAYGWDPNDPGTARLKGRAPQSADEIVVDPTTLDNAGLKVGDRTKVVVGGEVRDVKIVGVVLSDTAIAGATLTFFDQATATELFASDGQVALVAVYGDGIDLDTLVDRIAATAKAAGGEAISADAYRKQAKNEIADQLGFVTTFLMVFAGVALFVGAFIIANTFSMTVRQRLAEFALLRAVGASPTQVFASIVVQAAVVGLLGSAIGVLLGFALVLALRAVFDQMGMALSGAVPVSAGSILTAVTVGVVVSVVSALLPARRAAKIPPVEAMRDQTAAADRRSLTRTIIGAVLTAGGAFAAWWAWAHPSADAVGLAIGAGALGVLVGLLVLGPVLVPAVVRVLAVPLRALRPMGRLAQGNVVRNPRRTANTAGALTIGMALVGAGAVLAGSAQASIHDMVTQEVRSQFVLTAASIPSGLLRDAEAVDGVADVFAVPWSGALASTSASPGADDFVIINGTDPLMSDTAFDLLEQSAPVDQVLTAGKAAVPADAAARRGWHVGDTLTIVSTTTSVQVEIGATIRTNIADEDIFLNKDVLDQLVAPADQITSLAIITTKPGADLDKVATGLTAAAAPYLVVTVQSTQEFTDAMAGQVTQILTIFYALVGLSILIAGIGIVNTLALSVIERTREIGLLRAVGLGRMQLGSTLTIESVLTALAGTTIGLVTGVALASTAPRLLSDQGFNTLAIPWSGLVVMFVLAIVLGAVAAVWPGIRAARLKVLDAISYE